MKTHQMHPAPSFQMHSSVQGDDEQGLVRRFVQVAVQSGVEADAVTIVSCYVALKWAILLNGWRGQWR